MSNNEKSSIKRRQSGFILGRTPRYVVSLIHLEQHQVYGLVGYDVTPLSAWIDSISGQGIPGFSRHVVLNSSIRSSQSFL